MKLLKLGRACLIATMIGGSFTAFAQTTPPANDNNTMESNTDQMSSNTNANASTSGTMTQMTQDDQNILTAVNKILTDGGCAGVEASVTAGVVTLKGSAPEDKMKAATDAISKIPGVSSVNTSEVNQMDATKDMQPLTPTTAAPAAPVTPGQE